MIRRPHIVLAFAALTFSACDMTVESSNATAPLDDYAQKAVPIINGKHVTLDDHLNVVSIFYVDRERGGSGVDYNNGLIDCDDPECKNSEFCIPNGCENNADDNGDGFVDCHDPECINYVKCQPENCINHNNGRCVAAGYKVSLLQTIKR